MDIGAIIAENRRRLAEIQKAYNPLVGTAYSDKIPRVSLVVRDAITPVMYIPAEMDSEDIVVLLRRCGTLSKAGRAVFGGAASERKSVRIWKEFCKVRVRYDFEYWCATQIKIKLKGKGQRSYFILNRAQRYYLTFLEELRKQGKPIEIVLCKARQWGGSTMTQMYMFWIQKVHKRNWNSVICGDVEKQSKVVLSMLENAAREYDPFIDDGEPTRLRPYGRTDSVREIVGRGCTISIGSAQEPDKIRCEDISMCHLTEVGLWKSTASKSPEDLVEAITGAILEGAYTLMVLESTAKGVGNFFHHTWLDAVHGRNGFTPVFVPWFMIDIYSRELEMSEEGFVESMSEYEHCLFRLGASLQAICWYREKSRKMDDFRMKSEYPSTADEAFQSTGARFFKEAYLHELQQGCMPARLVGEIVSKHTDTDKRLYLSDLSFVEDEHGHLKIWEDVDRSRVMRNRYLVTVDLGRGATDDADKTIACVWDRYWQRAGEDGYPEVVAEYAVTESETDRLAWRIAQIAAYYQNALLVIESNTIDSSREDRFRAVLDEIKEHYPNLYKRPVSNKTDVGNTGGFRYGWNTNHASKEEICSDLNWALREGMYVERNQEAVDEMAIFERHTDGSLGAVEGRGNHDDRVITRALGVHFCYKKMDAPVEVSANGENGNVVKRKIVTDMAL